MRKAVLCILAVAWLAPRVVAADEVHTIVEAGTAQGTALGSPWQPRPSYNVSLLGLRDSGQGFGARFSLQPAGSSAEPWGLSADAAEYERLMAESALTLERLRRIQLPAGAQGPPIQEPGRGEAPRANPENGAPRVAPPASGKQAVVEPAGEDDTPLEAHNPWGQHGRPDHQTTVEFLKKLAGREFPTAEIEAGISIYKYTGINRRRTCGRAISRLTRYSRCMKPYASIRTAAFRPASN